MKKIVIEALYPEFNNLYGDRGNLRYLEQKSAAMGCETEIISTGLFDTPVFATEKTVDLLYIGPCTEMQQELTLEHLMPYRDALQKRTENGGLTLATGNAFELFGEKIIRADNTEVPALGFWPTVATRFSRLRYNELCLGEWKGLTVVGFKNQLSHSTGEVPEAFLQMKTGTGLNPKSMNEGCVWNNALFATYLIGPILPLNPPFSAALLRRLVPDCEPVLLPFEQEAYEARVRELSNPAANQQKHH